MTPTMEASLRDLQSEFAAEVAQGNKVGGLIVLYPDSNPTPDLIRLAAMAGDLPPIDNLAGELEAGRLSNAFGLEKDGITAFAILWAGDAPARRRFEQLAKDACRVLFQETSPSPSKWVRLLLDLAWRKVPGSPLIAAKWWGDNRTRFMKPDDSETIPRASSLSDLFRASKQAIDLYLHEAVELPGPQVAAKPAKAPPNQTPPEGNGVAARNRWFRDQNEAEGTKTYHSQAAIRDKWNGMTIEERTKICPEATNNVTRETVIKGIDRATPRDGKSRKKPKRGTNRVKKRK